MFAGRTWAEKDGAQLLPTLLLRVQKDCIQVFSAPYPEIANAPCFLEAVQ